MNEKNIIFRTKRDINGNTYYLIVEIEEKDILIGYNMGFRFYDEAIETTKKGLRSLEKKFELLGFTICHI